MAYHNDRATTAFGPLPNAEVCDAEALGALKAMELMCARCEETLNIIEVHLYLDNSAVADGLRGKPPASMQHAYLQFQKLAK